MITLTRALLAAVDVGQRPVVDDPDLFEHGSHKSDGLQPLDELLAELDRSFEPLDYGLDVKVGLPYASRSGPWI